MKKLALTKETLQTLNGQQVDQAAGAMARTWPMPYPGTNPSFLDCPTDYILGCQGGSWTEVQMY